MTTTSVTGSVLLVDDNTAFASMVAEVGRQSGCSVQRAATLAGARRLLAQDLHFDLLLVDLMLPDGNGLALLEELDLAGQGRIVIVTGTPSVESAVRTLRLPALDYLVKPVPSTKWRELFHAARDRALTATRTRRPLGGMLGASASMQAVFARIRQVGPLDVSVLVHGESGTGKELAARALHEASGRSGRFVAVNCGAVERDLLGSQLFGHERGAFTGALQAHTGFFEQAEGGTLLLDEITEMPRQLQVYLLRVLESHRLTRLGGAGERPIDVRVVAATNRDPQVAMQAGELREDLYYRLVEFPLYLPPLRERTEDIGLLAGYFLDRLNRKYRTAKTFHPDALRRMRDYAWPGNVRELRHAVQRHYILAGDAARVEYQSDADGGLTGIGGTVRFEVGMSFEQVERKMLLKTLARCGNNQTWAAKVLGITPRTLRNRLQRYRAEASAGDGETESLPALHDTPP